MILNNNNDNNNDIIIKFVLHEAPKQQLYNCNDNSNNSKKNGNNNDNNNYNYNILIIVNTGKTEVMVSGRNETKVNIKDKEGKELNQVDQFKYLGVIFSEKGGSETAVRARVKAAWQKCREM